MIPEADLMLNAAAGKLLVDIAPNMTPGYSQGSASTLAMVMILAAQEYGRSADTRAWENAAMRAILSGAGVDVGEVAPTFAIADLNAENTRLSRALIVLHEKAETGGDRETEQAILAFLKESADRRRLHLPAL